MRSNASTKGSLFRGWQREGEGGFMLSDRSLVLELATEGRLLSIYLFKHTHKRSQTRILAKLDEKCGPKGVHVWSNKCYDRWKMHEPIAKALPHAIPRAWCRFYDTWLPHDILFRALRYRSWDSIGRHKYDIPASGGIRRTSSARAFRVDDVYKRNMSMILPPPARLLSAD